MTTFTSSRPHLLIDVLADAVAPSTYMAGVQCPIIGVIISFICYWIRGDSSLPRHFGGGVFAAVFASASPGSAFCAGVVDLAGISKLLNTVERRHDEKQN